jgi:RimJ/RimL family protein N-acetyltransferase
MSPGLHLLPSQKLAAQNRLLAISTFRSVVIAFPTEREACLSAKLLPLADRHLITTFDVINALRDDIAGLGPQLFHGVFVASRFRPFHSSSVRRLSREDLPRLERLRAGVHPVEWQHSGLENANFATLYGCELDGELTAAAHYTGDGEGTASIGSICHSSYRGRGMASATTSAAVEHALSAELLTVYQTLADNTPSVQMALKLGCSEFARSFRAELCV